MTKRTRVEITPEIHAKLNEEFHRTGLGGSALLRGKRGQYPNGLRSDMIDAWRAGIIATAKPEHLDWVLEYYSQWKPPLKTKAPTRIKLTNEQIRHLQAEVERTGLGAVAILKHAPKPLPEGLNHQKIQRWVSGKTISVRGDHWHFVLSLYAQLDGRGSN